jgi:hypothetical protein
MTQSLAGATILTVTPKALVLKAKKKPWRFLTLGLTVKMKKCTQY